MKKAKKTRESERPGAEGENKETTRNEMKHNFPVGTHV